MACHRLARLAVRARIALAAGCTVLCVAAVACGGGEESTETGTPAAGTPAERNVELSADFPDDIPSPPDSEQQSSAFIPGQGGIAMFTSDASRNDLRDFYSKELAGEGWSVDAPSEADVRTVIKATKGNRTTNVIISSGPKGSEVVITAEGG